ncbi:MAG: cell division protein FtsA [Candidatus Jacksonbacteria bacterium RIFOXYC2_FULL_44_29]|nr:MAG: Cell division protein ftsA [Parcubacteria group bacterium GW2011_GWC2_44_22]OGY75488.1 MAG: cell division protein FtsA [Candidatus Jacksonbacteria bacterium RIFOXYA2_FULL_43_12]OGY76984.1 MAG: cell division protein FtsA [Candidatus Jacksonbacteria bacterium RIFOXYB2_FULL_44_15]OGY77836.1 MAG: cell division protein FtsA [Candidatus Jacksonbacteria bacterium RIFOXYC2_FULL_44_29]OGY80253.1 MAG: cell division protein FtsA [Candidatus Jacksonbacteria bacterium RIFOXYD2_FULL_43_21]HBH46115.1
MRDTIIAGLDIGSSKIRVAVGQKIDGHELNIVGLAEVPSEGVSKGTIKSVEDAVSSISRAFESAERMTGVPVERALVSISGTHIKSDTSKGVIAVAKADGEIKPADVERVIEAAQAVSTPPNYEILHVIPKTFTVDSQSGIKDPVGMTGIRLEVEVQIIQGLSTQIKNLTKVVYRAGVEVDDLVLASLAASEAVITARQKELGVCVLSIGASTTGLAVFEEGEVIHSHVIPIGAGHITNDIAIGLRTSIDTAEEIKIKYGSAMPEEIGRKEDLDLARITEGEVGVVSRHHIAEIIEARMEEIFKLADVELAKIERSGKLPAGIILTGGGAKLDGVMQLARRIFKLPAAIGFCRAGKMAIDRVEDPSVSTAIGLVLWGEHLIKNYGANERMFSNKAGEFSAKVKKWFKSFLP